MICPKCGRSLPEDKLTCDFCDKYAKNSQKPIENLDEYIESFKVESKIDIYTRRIKNGCKDFWDDKPAIAKVCLITLVLIVLFWILLFLISTHTQKDTPEEKIVAKVEKAIKDNSKRGIEKQYLREIRDQAKIDLNNSLNMFIGGWSFVSSTIYGEFEEVDIDESKCYKSYDQLQRYLIKTYGLDKDKITNFATYKGKFTKKEDNPYSIVNEYYKYICIILIEYDGKWGVCSYEEYASKFFDY